MVENDRKLFLTLWLCGIKAGRLVCKNASLIRALENLENRALDSSWPLRGGNSIKESMGGVGKHEPFHRNQPRYHMEN